MSEFLTAVSILLPLKATTKNEILRELIRAVPYDRTSVDEETVYRTVLERETVTSTGIGDEVAIPHAKCNIREELTMALGISGAPVEFDALDKKPVRIFFLLLSRKDAAGPHLRMLARIAKLLRQGTFKQELLACATSEAVLVLLRKLEAAEAV